MRFWWVFASATYGFSPLISDDVVEQLKAQLSDKCGSACTNLLEEILPLLLVHKGTDSEFSQFNKFLNTLISNGKESNLKILSDINDLKSGLDHNEWNEIGIFRPHHKNVTAFALSPQEQPLAGNMLPPPEAGFPCRTQAECDSLDFKLNRCAHIRTEAMNAYVGSNVALNVMSALVTALCGCIFAGPINVCPLKGIPYICGFPYMAYQGIYGVSTGIWSAVVMLTNLCTSGGLA